jgi:putative oxidoreductase
MIDRARLETITYAALRMVTGFMLLFHGIQKLFGMFTTKVPPEVLSQRWVGGVIELVGGTLIMFGLFTRPAAFISAGMMAVAYWQFHAIERGKLLPIENGGELAALYCFVMLFIFARGAGAISLDRQLRRG